MALFWQLPVQRLQPNVIAANSLLSALARSLQWQLALSHLAQLNAPNVISFNTVLAGCRNHWHTALELLRTAKEQSVAPNAGSFAACIVAAGQASEWPMALSLLALAGEGGLAANSALGALAEAAQWQRALELLAGLASPDVVSFNSVMRACERGHEWQRAMEIFSELQARGEASDISVCSALSALGRAVHWQRGLQLLSQRPSGAPVFGAALHACAQAAQWQAAVAVLASMHAAAVEPDDSILGSLATMQISTEARAFLRQSRVRQVLRQESHRWLLRIDVGRTMGSFMPLRWATDGSRLLLPMIVQFRKGGQLAVHRVGDFMGDWDSPPNTALGPLPFEEEGSVSPSINAGQWEMLEAQEGRVVQFHVESSGFKRGSIWLPPRKLFFKGKVYGEILSGGKNATVSIRENLLLYGIGVALLLAFVWGPVALVGLILLALREVSISVGTWSIERLEGDPDTEPLPPVTLKGDVPEKWV
ncbi:unnamed protein product [Effrenium voratum]|nr:unnamed protein product [Effrenium voratum]